MSKIKKGSVCKGNKLQEFDMTNTDFTKTPVTFRMGNEIIHNPSCHILCRKSQSFCPSCMQQRRTLMVQKCRAQCHNTNRTDPTTTVSYKYLTKEEMKHRMETLHKQLTKVKKQRDRLENKIKTLIAKQSLSLNQNDHNDLKEIVLNECDQVTHQTSLHRIFWEQQVQALKKSDSRAIRWHPLMIKLCILIRHQSQAAYETMRQCIRLPSQRLLRDYTH
ncbi:PREDICTED: uncharacterized protein LOC109584970 [Amphimedon queenslandica]|uniref:Uncharacterized protein n=1 Tax=Amphimedon queenslandica TaxID=400682 RepID=A0A1X7VX00_AMPQE|nr:PREDICTED: uncharacterized protein LOC109584970 [Amphimedon queenslandica]|eukprot:XP_019856455.1 PREDICTED: uncharacterized protein LOC109584970 [Amphimedon queenslandica]